MNRYHYIFFGILLAALIVRIFSVQWNIFPHGDTIGDVKAAASFVQEQRLRVSDEPNIYSVPDFFPPGIGRNLLTAHPPLWALLGAGLVFILPLEADATGAYFSMQLLTLFFGMMVIGLAALLAYQLFDKRASLFMAVWMAASYLMIDYSANGSLYALQTVWYLLWILVAYKHLPYKPVWLGVIAGLGYLTNHQAMVLAASSVPILLFYSDRSWKQRIPDVVIVTIVTFLVAFPWLLRNYLIYGDFFFSHAVNATYLYVKGAVPYEVVDGRIQYLFGFSEKISYFTGVFTVWLPNNLYYVARKLFILVPVLFFFFSFAWIDYLFDRTRVRTMMPVLLLFLLHLFLSTTWPVTKFRYFVPMLPLVYLIGLDQLYSLRWSERLQKSVLWLTTGCLLLVSYLTFLSNPLHTYYYDGAVTQDPFHGNEEIRYLQKHGLLPSE